MKNLSDIHIVVLILGIVLRFLRSYKIEASKPGFEPWQYWTASKIIVWGADIVASVTALILLPEFIQIVVAFFPKWADYIKASDLIITFSIGFAGYDIFKYGSRYSAVLGRKAWEMLLSKLSSKK
jgi:hypothetical protein|tara:strand:+ start:5533 stop:5907 length:375 start_codon:yes stop_codon:yes gene_type:complete